MWTQAHGVNVCVAQGLHAAVADEPDSTRLSDMNVWVCVGVCARVCACV